MRMCSVDATNRTFPCSRRKNFILQLKFDCKAKKSTHLVAHELRWSASELRASIWSGGHREMMIDALKAAK